MSNKYSQKRSQLADRLLSQHPLHDADVSIEVIVNTIRKALQGVMAAEDIEALLVAEGLKPASVEKAIIPDTLVLSGGQRRILGLLCKSNSFPYIFRQYANCSNFSLYLNGRPNRGVRKDTVEYLIKHRLIYLSDKGVYQITPLGAEIVKHRKKKIQ